MNRAGNGPGQIRTGMLIGSLALALLIGIRHLLPGEAASGGSFDAFCPFGAIETLWRYARSGETLRTTSLLNFAIMGGVLAVSLAAGRAFCGWMCPLGAAQEFLGRLGRRLDLSVRLPERADRLLRPAKYLILAAVLLASLSAVHPPLHGLCPARAALGLQWQTGLLISVLVTFIVTSLLNERVWCKYLCPLGALLAIFNRTALLRLVTDPGRCNQCGRCDLSCSMDLRDLPTRGRDLECIQCLACLDTCAREGALELKLGR